MKLHVLAFLMAASSANADDKCALVNDLKTRLNCYQQEADRAAASAMAAADRAVNSYDIPTFEDVCRKAGGLAAFAMMERQTGVLPLDVVDHMTSKGAGDLAKRREAALDAFTVPLARNHAEVLSAIKEYTAKYQLLCLKGDILR